jgi:LacI family transcriptional regulator
MAVTIKDVARQAGVSVRTVSRAVNNMNDVSSGTRERILTVARKLGYRPSLLARALVTHRSRTIGLVLPHITNPYFSDVAQGFFNAARENGFSVLFNNCSWATLPDLEGLYNLADYAVEGMITDVLYGHEADILAFSKFLSPIVVLNHPLTSAGVSSVLADIPDGAVQAMTYLIGKGHRHIGMVAPTVDHPERVDRATVYQKVMLENGQEPCIQYIDPVYLEPDIEAGYQTSLRLLENFPEVSAIFCYNDLIALGLFW